jgi:hypothetical protein
MIHRKGDDMTHEDAGHYAAKHAGATINPVVALELKKRISDGTISCPSAHAVARDLMVSPADVGVTIDLLEARIVLCQLGLFGWAGREEDEKPAGVTAASLRQAIDAALVNGRLPCAEAWSIAETFKLPRKAVKTVCDDLNIKMCCCQLGAFA